MPAAVKKPVAVKQPAAVKQPGAKKKASSSVLFTQETPYQTIQLVKHHGGLLLKLNGSWQVHTNEEKLYHEAFATVPLMLAEKVEKVVILGGGDGLAFREGQGLHHHRATRAIGALGAGQELGARRQALHGRRFCDGNVVIEVRQRRTPQSSPRVLLGREPLAAAGAATVQDLAAVLGRHAQAETMTALTHEAARLIGALHGLELRSKIT